MSEERLDAQAIAAMAPGPPMRLRELTATNIISDEVHTVTVEISAPYPVVGLDWVCTLAFPGHPEPPLRAMRPLFGIDAWQALNAALHIAQIELKRLGGRHQLTWLGGAPYDADQRI